MERFVHVTSALQVEKQKRLLIRRSRFFVPLWGVLVPQAGIEPATYRLEGECSIR